MAKRLPLPEYLPNADKFVLNVDTVVQILAEYVIYDGDWECILQKAVPERKQKKGESRQPKGGFMPNVTTYDELLGLTYKEIKSYNFRGLVTNQVNRHAKDGWLKPVTEYQSYHVDKEEKLLIHVCKFELNTRGSFGVFVDEAEGRSRKEALARVSWKCLMWMKRHDLIRDASAAVVVDA